MRSPGYLAAAAVRTVDWRFDRFARRREFALRERFDGHTMIHPGRYVDNLTWASRIRSIPGQIVECGVWRGGMIAGIASILGPDRTYVLADSFQGLPIVADVDGAHAKAWQADTTSPTFYDNATAAESEAREAMRMAGIADPAVLAGWFDDTLPAFAAKAEPIALLRLDADLFSSTMTCLEHLFPLVAPGDVVLIDDYGDWDGCTRAVHRYLADELRPEPICCTPRSGVFYLVKRDPAPA